MNASKANTGIVPTCYHVPYISVTMDTNHWRIVNPDQVCGASEGLFTHREARLSLKHMDFSLPRAPVCRYSSLPSSPRQAWTLNRNALGSS